MQQEPYWWDAAPRPRIEPGDPPRRVDVAVVGSGYTGLSAALHLAEGGAGVAVFDGAEIGSGASSRNAGFVGRTLKHGFGDILKARGLERAVAVYREMQQVFDGVGELIARHRIDCGYKANGRLVLAATPRQYDALAAEYDLRRRHLGSPFDPVGGPDLAREIATDRYCGGVIVPDLAALHPGLYHQGMVAAARAAGVALLPLTPVTRLDGDAAGWRVQTARGTVEARHVVVATNGHSGDLLPWLRRRLIPFDAWMIATAELPEPVIARLLPDDRTYIDSNMNIDFIRRSPDGRRVIFGGKTGTKSTIPVMARRLAAELRAIFPDLARTEITHAWTGRCAATFDLDPHLGRHAGIHYGAGYCFAGVPMGTHFGRLIANRILGRGPQESVFADRPFPTLPLYAGNTWFVPWMMRYYDWRDGKRHLA